MVERPADREMIAAVAKVLAGARSALFITGAGISADSGLPTYRGIGGLYEQDDPEEGLPIEAALSGEMLAQRPDVCWKYIHQIEQSCRGAEFNAGHRAIADFERQLDRVWVLTQNVDGFHGDAGSGHLIEIHGNVHHLLCTRCTWSTKVADYSELDMPPSCPDCSALVRPAVVLFGETLPTAALAALQEQLREGFDVVLSVGTSSLFPYIAQPVLEARARGKVTVEINPGTTPVSHVVAHRIQERGAVALTALWKAFAALRGVHS